MRLVGADLIIAANFHQSNGGNFQVHGSNPNPLPAQSFELICGPDVKCHNAPAREKAN
jgi:hypothetical protein